MPSLKNFFRFALAALVIGLGVSYVLAGWSPPPTGTPPISCNTYPNAPGCAAPINVGSDPSLQTKTGQLFINNDLTARRLIVPNSVGPSGARVMIGDGARDNPDDTAILDVDGQIRIRDGNFGSGTLEGKVLTAANDDGLAQWQTYVPGLIKLVEGFGINLGDNSGLDGAGAPGEMTYLPSELTSSGYIAVWTGIPFNNPATPVSPDDNRNPNDGEAIQVRVTGTPCASPRAITAVAITGPATCSPFVTTVTANSTSGLTLTAAGGPTTAATSGPISLAVNVGAGLWLDSADNKIKLNVNEAAGAGDGLTISGNQLKFEPCGANQTWKYNTGTSKWECADFPAPSLSMPGESVMYLRVKDTVSAPPVCPTLPSPGWIPSPNASGLSYTGKESVSAGGYNKMRACYRSDKSCQVIYIRSITSSPANCPTSPNVWSDAVGETNEWTPEGGTNYVRTCYICS